MSRRFRLAKNSRPSQARQRTLKYFDKFLAPLSETYGSVNSVGSRKTENLMGVPRSVSPVRNFEIRATGGDVYLPTLGGRISDREPAGSLLNRCVDTRGHGVPRQGCESVHVVDRGLGSDWCDLRRPLFCS